MENIKAAQIKIIEKFLSFSISDTVSKLKLIYSRSKKDDDRLIVLSARIEILKQRYQALKRGIYIPGNENLNTLFQQSTQGLKISKESLEEAKTVNEVDQNKELGQVPGEEESWLYIKMVKPGIINGIRIPVDAVVEVRESDANKLIEDEMAFLLENQGEETEINNKDKPAKKKKVKAKSDTNRKEESEVPDAEDKTQSNSEVVENSST